MDDKDVKATLEVCAANTLALRLCVEQMAAEHLFRQNDPEVLANFIHRLRRAYEAAAPSDPDASTARIYDMTGHHLERLIEGVMGRMSILRHGEPQ
jgi:DNA-binding GntR family transcriptional regulator